MRAAKWQNEPECMHETGEKGGPGVSLRGMDYPFLLSHDVRIALHTALVGRAVGLDAFSRNLHRTRCRMEKTGLKHAKDRWMSTPACPVLIPVSWPVFRNNRQLTGFCQDGT